MASFTNLKSKRAQKSTSFIVNLNDNDNNEIQMDEPETTLVDSEISSELPEQREPSSVTFTPGQKTRNIDVSSTSTKLKDIDLLYPSLPNTLQVRDAGSRGRGVWTTMPKRMGEIIYAETPSVAALSTRHLSTHCSACFQESKTESSSPLKRCPSCRLLYYCDSECQTRDWPSHKRECPALQKWIAAAPATMTTTTEAFDGSSTNAGSGPLIASDAIRVLGRLLWKRQRKGIDSIWAKQIDAMQSHRATISNNEQSSELHTHMVHALVRYVGIESANDLMGYGISSIGALVDLVSRFTTNAFAVTTPSLTPIGACIAPTVALFNHSCEPNAVLVFPRTGTPQNSKKEQSLHQVIAIKNIEPDEEVVISYVDTTLSYIRRQKALKETYHFICECSLCTKIKTRQNQNQNQTQKYVDPREGMYCPKKCGGVCWLPTEENENELTRCIKCKAIVKDTDVILDAVRIGQEGLDKADRVQFTDPQKAIQLTSNLIPILSSAGLLPSSHPLLGLSRLHTTLLITYLQSPFDNSNNNNGDDTIELDSPQIQEYHHHSNPETPTTNIKMQDAQEKLDETVRSASRTCSALNQVLSYGHPVRGIALAELGKLLSADEPFPKHIVDAVPNSNSNTLHTSTTAHSESSLPPQHQIPKLAGTLQYPPSGPQRLKLAYETLVRARGELLVGFGGGKNEGGEVGLEVRKLIVDVEREFGVWKDGIKKAMDVQAMKKNK